MPETTPERLVDKEFIALLQTGATALLVLMKSGDTRVMVATNVFGMGIDKQDVRFVLHYQMPSGLDTGATVRSICMLVSPGGSTLCFELRPT